jgi:hypothetical protein
MVSPLRSLKLRLASPSLVRVAEKHERVDVDSGVRCVGRLRGMPILNGIKHPIISGATCSTLYLDLGQPSTAVSRDNAQEITQLAAENHPIPDISSVL